jgi:hypothetical protein
MLVFTVLFLTRSILVLLNLKMQINKNWSKDANHRIKCLDLVSGAMFTGMEQILAVQHHALIGFRSQDCTTG